MIAQRTQPERLAEYMPLIKRRISGWGIPPQDIDDRAHDIFILLLQDLKTYDPKKQPFTNWLHKLIYFRIVDSLRHTSVDLIRLSRTHRKTQVWELDTVPVNGTVVQFLKTSKDKQYAAVSSGPFPYTYNREGDYHEYEPCVNDSGCEQLDIQDQVCQLLKLVKPRARKILLAYLQGQTFKEISVTLGCSESRVSQIYTKALTHLKKHARTQVHLSDK
jgi:RNA polymerase sigma factor (sigma-70 family)